MKLQINYLNNQNGKLQAVQLPIAEWEKLQEKVLFYEQKLNLRQDLSEAFKDVAKMRQKKSQSRNFPIFWMKFKVIPTDKFRKQAKRLVKKYASLKTELAELGSTLQENPQTGTA